MGGLFSLFLVFFWVVWVGVGVGVGLGVGGDGGIFN